ncbi:uncharacterized protein LOC129361543 isoform X2 [Poeciliopsis prolifica]|uniref:uncharacterized protein LOC129361543 isoform X2 n=1 Tax=Poeciliopsis prolifica TaxID=188132 RepID=UPI0024138BE7|nr:uncharacterized protein LOC129361543 isoform X2 [Poeciliopsis prolifica]
MFSVKQAALLFIRLLQTTYVFAAPATADHYDVSVSRGDPVVLTCEIFNENTTVLKWTKDRWYFIHSISNNQTFSNFSSHRLRIDTNKPSTLSIDNTHHDDAGFYSCHISGKKGLYNMSWTVTVLENQNGTSSLQYIMVTIPSAFGFLSCCSALTVCLCRRKTSRNQTPNSRTFTSVQYNILNGMKVVPSLFQTTAIWRRTDKQDVEAAETTRGTMITSHHSGND